MSVSDKLAKQLLVEREAIHRLIETHRSLLEKCISFEPSLIEISALGTVLHSFYTAVENIFKRIILECDKKTPQGEEWHNLLLVSMTHPSSFRTTVISVEMEEILQDYLAFRHVFRHAYPFELRWVKMKPLVVNLEGTFLKLEKYLDDFILSYTTGKKNN